MTLETVLMSTAPEPIPGRFAPKPLRSCEKSASIFPIRKSICAPEFGAEPLADSGFEDEEPDPHLKPTPTKRKRRLSDDGHNTGASRRETGKARLPEGSDRFDYPHAGRGCRPMAEAVGVHRHADSIQPQIRQTVPRRQCSAPARHGNEKRLLRSTMDDLQTGRRKWLAGPQRRKGDTDRVLGLRIPGDGDRHSEVIS